MISSKRNICVFTSTRAEYGLLRSLFRFIQASSQLYLKLLVSGAHLTAEQGMTIEEIVHDGFEPHECIDIDLSDDSTEGISKSMGLAVSGYGRYFTKHRPDILVLLGDRFETFCCAAAAQIARIPIAHIHGGETTEGAVDEAFRHSITKMAHIHFPSCEQYRHRIIQMGESPAHVFNVGALGAENINSMTFLSRSQLEQSIGFRLDAPFFLITFHPVTLEGKTSHDQFAEFLLALNQFPDHKCVFTYANADMDSRTINQMINDYGELNSNRCYIAPSLGYHRYLSAMKLCDAVIGNSSSGILEAPVLGVPSINIGDRQRGRIRTKSIVDCHPACESIVGAIKKIYSEKFRSCLQNLKVPWDKLGTAKEITDILSRTNLSGILKKEFYDIDFR